MNYQNKKAEYDNNFEFGKLQQDRVGDYIKNEWSLTLSPATVYEDTKQGIDGKYRTPKGLTTYSVKTITRNKKSCSSVGFEVWKTPCDVEIGNDGIRRVTKVYADTKRDGHIKYCIADEEWHVSADGKYAIRFILNEEFFTALYDAFEATKYDYMYEMGKPQEKRRETTVSTFFKIPLNAIATIFPVGTYFVEYMDEGMRNMMETANKRRAEMGKAPILI